MRDRSPGPAAAVAARAALFVFGLWATPIAAAQTLDLQIFAPGPGRSAAVTLPDLRLPPHGTLRVGISGGHARRPWVREVACDANDLRSPRCQLVVINAMSQLQVGFAVSLFEAIQLGIALPGVSSTVGDLEEPRDFSRRTGLSDLRLSVDAPLLSGDTALGVSLVVALPTGAARTWAAEDSWIVTPSLIAQQRLGPLRLSLGVGYRLRQPVVLVDARYNDELDLALGAMMPVLGSLDARVEYRMRLPLGGDGPRAARSPAELDAALGYRIGPQWLLTVGAGGGVAPGENGYGAPDVRVFAGLAFELAAVPCEFGPEDFDGYRDGDSCRDPDNDGDQRLDIDDQCPDDPEDLDGFEDDDGCPDSDNDADGLLDAADRCPERSEDRDGFEDGDGCPEPDNDSDRMLDALDACPLDPEDIDDYEDDDGCPEPGPTPLSVRIEERRILVSERIYFDDDRDTIREVSRPVLDQVAGVIRSLPRGLKVIVEGHTDDAGNPAHNLDLSHRRARAVVEYLRGRGVAPEQLDYVGYGATRPLGPNDSPEGRALNRRVEFTLAR